MKKHEVPQDQDPAFEGGKKLCYAVDENGKFVSELSSGWQVESAVKDLAWQSIRDGLEQCRVRVSKGEASPLEYFMLSRQMEPGLLAQNVGTFKWRVRRHLRPEIFKSLSEEWVSRYAECLDIDPATLRGFTGVT